MWLCCYLLDSWRFWVQEAVNEHIGVAECWFWKLSGNNKKSYGDHGIDGVVYKFYFDLTHWICRPQQAFLT